MNKSKIVEVVVEKYRGQVPFWLNSFDESIVYLCSSNRNIEDYYNVLKDIYDGKVLKLESNSYQDEIERDNFELLELLKSGGRYIILISLEAFFREYFLSGKRYILKLGDSLNLKDLEKELEENGYVKNYMVEERNQYSIRGDILDIFPKNSENPLRVELSFGDEIERITYFDIENQKSIEKKSEIEMYINSNKDEKNSFLSLLKRTHGAKFWIENIELLRYKLEEFIQREPEKEKRAREDFQKLESLGELMEIVKFSHEEVLKFENNNYVRELAQNKNLRVRIVSEEEKRYQEIFVNCGFEFEKYPLFEGYRDGKLLVLTDRELKGIRVRREKGDRRVQKYKAIGDIEEGDYIMHENYGVGIYLGIETIDGHEYLKIKYADEDRLFVPIEGMGKIGKYISNIGEVPEIFRLGRKGFKKKKEKLEEEMLLFAKEIVQIQAKRDLQAGYAFSPDTLLQEEFEEGFPYRETESQLKAIEDVKRDMESTRVMDRVVCGDVGIGKTEVAIRAAFKAAVDEKQVALMVPTTVLAQQHYERFYERMKNFPINIEILSRLDGDKGQREVLKKLKNGGVDIVIGTHRLLSKDVEFKDLGLVIIDEEQKFGVRAKEHLKKLKDRVDMLTLTATPIPRTLNLSLLGIRDLSVIDTPPDGRKPIETYFVEGNDENIRDVIMRELAREGQVFYIFNSVRGIEKKTQDLAKLLPEYVKLDFVHGKMTPRDIKDKLKEFENGEIDVLVATTIIENGIDIENANTMIIDRVEKLGLSQIYQLRGRVGRGDRKSYCYLLTKEFQTKKAQEREESLRVIEETGGGGLQLSMEDMRIRGAGEILGDKQHGALETYGYTLYMKMLQDEIAKIKGEFQESMDDIELKVNYPAFIPNEYIEKNEKIKIYRRISDVKNVEELDRIAEELVDRFGKLPVEAQGLFEYMKLKLEIREFGIKSAVEIKGKNISRIKFQRDRAKIEILLKMIQGGVATYQSKSEMIEYEGSIVEFLREYERIGGENERV